MNGTPLSEMTADEIRSIGSTYPNPDPGAADQTSVQLKLAKDVAISSFLVFVWLTIENVASGATGYWHWLSAIVGYIAGAKVITDIHEWGHFTGARLSGAHSPIASLSSFNVFNFNMIENSGKQFLWMSAGAHLFDIPATIILILLIPDQTPGQLAIQAGALLVSVTAFYTDHGVVLRLLRGSSPVEAWQPYKEFMKGHRIIGLILGLTAGAAFIFLSA